VEHVVLLSTIKSVRLDATNPNKSERWRLVLKLDIEIERNVFSAAWIEDIKNISQLIMRWSPAGNE
jgi:hypothetical protein